MSDLLVQPQRREGTEIVLEARLHREGSQVPLWFRVPATVESWLTSIADPFVAAFCFRFMSDGEAVRVHGAVTPTLLRNLEEYMLMWQAWHPDRYCAVAIEAEAEAMEYPERRESPAMLCFSGGLDSSYTAWRHHHGLARRAQARLTTGIFVHGADIPLDRPDGYARRFGQNRSMLQSLGMSLVPVQTNARSLGINWEHAHGSVLAGSMMLFQETFSRGLLASSMPYQWYGNQWGSTPWTDHLLSGGRMRIASDGGDSQRVEKVERMLGWPEFHRYLHVCWQGADPLQNCCRCEKCIRTLLSFLACGAEQPHCFPYALTPDDILRLHLRHRLLVQALQTVLDEARKRGTDVGPLFDAVKKTVRDHGPRGWWQRVRKHIRD